eukprot:TRINITY_DN1296_c0_g4_i1.p1 TRINITY_DN1296_c0_g4~~TRINITY_DN1296_c0_g4_i1.p1  ORF type:complete len:313 (+),score=92.41 TRINITY_DN1296_c0_g4_i1:66-941(+)
MSAVTVGVWQGAPLRSCPRESIAALGGAAAAAPGAELLVFPELFLQGYDIGVAELRRLAVPRPDTFAAFCRSVEATPPPGLNCALAVPYCELGTGGELYNSVAVFHCGGDLARNYRKCHLWDDGCSAATYERAAFRPGGPECLQPFELRLRGRALRCGVLVCFDIEFPEPARALALRGAEVLIVPTALCDGPVAAITPHCVIPTRALENHVHVLYSNFAGGGQEGGRIPFCGRSAIVGPDGVDLVRAGPGVGPALLTAQLDRGAFAGAVRRNDYLALRRPELYQGLVRARL